MYKFLESFIYSIDKLDKQISSAYFIHIDSSGINKFAEYYGKVGIHLFWLIPLLFYLLIKDYRYTLNWLAFLIVSLLLLNLTVDVMKDYFLRMRPLTWLDLQPDMKRESMPSGHVANMYALYFSMAYFKNKISKSVIVFLGFMAFTSGLCRFLALKHYIGDIIIAILLSYLIVHITFNLLNNITKKPVN